MQESLKLFGQVINSKFFETKPIILFLNKSDIFKQKLETTPISVAFPFYKGICFLADINLADMVYIIFNS